MVGLQPSAPDSLTVIIKNRAKGAEKPHSYWFNPVQSQPEVSGRVRRGQVGSRYVLVNA
jgi:hypothetical protein